jgi:uncharacterized protein YigA (DUF484 family)
MQTLFEAINDLIAARLDNMVGDLLKERLEQARRDEVDLRHTRELLTEKMKECDGFKNKFHELQRELAKHVALDTREANLEQRERDLEVTLLTQRTELQQYLIGVLSPNDARAYLNSKGAPDDEPLRQLP